MASSGVIYHRNRLLESGGVIVPSSEQSSFTREALMRPSLRDRLKWQQGWNVVSGVNDKIDFNRGGVKVATIAAGFYITAALYAAAVKAALQAADATPTWTVAQASGTGIWTISTAAHSFTLLFNTGTNATASPRRDLGYAASDLASSGNAVVGTTVVYSGLKFVSFDAPASETGWNVDSTNDTIEFVRSGAKTATVAHGFYTNGASMAAAVKVAFVAADPTQTWRVTYDEASQAFIIANDTPNNFDLTHGANSLLESLGFFGGETGSAGYNGVSGTVGSSFPSITTAFLRGHNIPDSATVTLQADSATLSTQGIDVSVDFTTTFSRDPDVRSDLMRADFAARGDRYWRLVVDARASGSPADTFTALELAVWFLGEALVLPGIDPALTDTRESLTTVSYAVGGAHVAVQRDSRRGWQLTIQLIDDDGKVTLEAFLDETRPGGMFFFNLDPDDDSFAVRYMFFVAEWNFVKVPERNGTLRLWTVRAELLEAVS